MNPLFKTLIYLLIALIITVLIGNLTMSPFITLIVGIILVFFHEEGTELLFMFTPWD